MAAINFSGTLQQFTMTLVNPYSGYTVYVDEEKNVNNSTYLMSPSGPNDNNLLIMSNDGDVLFLDDGNGNATIENIDIIAAFNANDIIIIADDTLTYGDIIISGGSQDDIIWGNIGDDFIDGLAGNDILDGGPGHDQLFGNSGTDRISGGDGDDEIDGSRDDDELYGDAGDDYILGGEDNDVLYGGSNASSTVVLDKDFVDDVVFPDLQEGVNIGNLKPPGTPALGVEDGNLSVDFEATATLTFRQGFAGYNNSLGIYRIAEDGTIESASLLWENVKDAGIDVAHQIDIPVGADGGSFGFFIIANGDRLNHGYNGLDTGADGNIKFVYNYGQGDERAATINDDGRDITVVYDDGTTEKVLKGHDYHTTPRVEETDNEVDLGGNSWLKSLFQKLFGHLADDPEALLNADHKIHSMSGLVDGEDGEVLRIGFEDLWHQGDADFEDVLFDLDINEVVISEGVPSGNDTLDGGFDDDILYGEDGDDVLMGGHGFDDLYGGSGADTFVFRADDLFDEIGNPIPAETHDTIFDFSSGEGDMIDISDLLTEFDPLTDAIGDFVTFTDNGGHTEMHVNSDGVGNDADLVAVFDGGIPDSVQDLFDAGLLIVS